MKAALDSLTTASYQPYAIHSQYQVPDFPLK